MAENDAAAHRGVSGNAPAGHLVADLSAFLAYKSQREGKRYHPEVISASEYDIASFHVNNEENNGKYRQKKGISYLGRTIFRRPVSAYAGYKCLYPLR